MADTTIEDPDTLSEQQKYALDIIPNLVVLDKLIYDCSTNNNNPVYNWEKRFDATDSKNPVDTGTYRGLFICDEALAFTTALSSFYPAAAAPDGKPTDSEDKSITTVNVALTPDSPYIYAVFVDETAANNGFSIKAAPTSTDTTECTIYEALF